jgi:hypothetical protein
MGAPRDNLIRPGTISAIERVADFRVSAPGAADDLPATRSKDARAAHPVDRGGQRDEPPASSPPRRTRRRRVRLFAASAYATLGIAAPLGAAVGVDHGTVHEIGANVLAAAYWAPVAYVGTKAWRKQRKDLQP